MKLSVRYASTFVAACLAVFTAISLAQWQNRCGDNAGQMANNTMACSTDMVVIVDVDKTIPPAIKDFENSAASLQANTDCIAQRPAKHTCAGTVFDDPNFQEFQDFQPSTLGGPWLAIPNPFAPRNYNNLDGLRLAD